MPNVRSGEAEGSLPTTAGGRVSIARRIHEHRSAYADELRRPFQMTVAQVPDETEPIPDGDETKDVTDSGPLGGPAF